MNDDFEWLESQFERVEKEELEEECQKINEERSKKLRDILDSENKRWIKIGDVVYEWEC